MTIIIQKSVNELTVSAHALKSILNIKLTRAGQRHASAMGFKSANHLIEAVKNAPVEREFEQYIKILKQEMAANHQIILNDEMVERLKMGLVSAGPH
ncbi:hypothetical protein [Aliiglaciecola litoralis]|uniref:Uncharacterized protein n=1 Tax=Aliiglaciecola litoralis TaxID=582857 RepID=A0ABN1LBU6_9ALTE